MNRRPYPVRYKPSATDGAKARQRAGVVLVSARSLDALTAESLARCYGLKEATAATMLAAERARRDLKEAEAREMIAEVRG